MIINYLEHRVFNGLTGNEVMGWKYKYRKKK